MLCAVILTLACALTAAQIDVADNHVSQRLDSLIESNRRPNICEPSVFNRTVINGQNAEIVKNVTEFLDQKDEAVSKDVDSVAIRRDTKEILNSEDSALAELVNFPSLNTAVSNIKDAECREQGLKVLIGLLLRKPWALQMFNASAKSFQVLFSNSSYDLGNFDECFGVTDESGQTIETQYCLASIKWRDNKEEKKVRTGRDEVIRWAICVPTACGADDIQDFIADVLSRTSEGNSTTVELTERNCSSKRPIAVNNLDAAFLIFCLLFAMMLVTGTVYDLMKCGKTNAPIMHDLLISFSLISNIKKIASTKQDNSMGLEWVSGVKSLAMFLTVAGHAFLFIVSGPVENPEAWDEFIQNPASSIPLSNHLLVDTFLFMSAFLFSYLLLADLEKRRGKVNMILIFILRYIRMTPPYLMVILFYMTWFPKIGAGPLWNERTQLEQERCMHSWWANILYINNIVNTDTICMFQSWYLAVDTQLAFFAPFVIYSLWRWNRAAPRILAISIIVSAVIPFVTTYVNQLDPTLMFYAKEYKDFAANFYFKEAYIKTYLRIVTYVMGIATGYILHQMRLKNYSFSRSAKMFGWTMTIVLTLVTMVPLTVFYQDWHDYNAVEAAAYMSLHKLTWGIVNGWVMLSYTTGGGGWLRSFLTWKVFVPISKVTFCAYLVNIVIELSYVGRLRYPLHNTFISLYSLVLLHVLQTFVLAFIFCITFESPIHGVLKVLFTRLVHPAQSSKENKVQTQTMDDTLETKSKDQ